ncbi:MAG: HD domain-containing protein [Fibrobacter sp.]|nr:HD domain-containing protein [Fibrobacter sp.]
MIIDYLLIVTVLSAINLVAMWFLNPKFNGPYPIICFLAFVSCVGHLLLGLSSNVSEAIIANKMNYIGATFLPMIMFYAVAAVCHVRINRIVSLLLNVFTLGVFGLSATVGFSDIYYKTIDYVQTHEGVGNYVATYGFGHDIFNLMIVGYLLANISLLVYAFAKKKNVSFRCLIAISLIDIVTILSFFISRLWGNDTLTMPLVYVFDQLALLYICYRVKCYDIGHSVLSVLERNNTDGYILLSSSCEFLGCNDIAYNIASSFKDCRVDHVLPAGNSEIDFFRFWVKEVGEGNYQEVKDFQVGNRHYRCTVKKVRLIREKYANLFKIVDDTDLHNYVQMLGDSNSRLETVVKSNANQLKSIQEQIIVGLANMVESRDSNTGGHIKRTSKVVSILVDDLRKNGNLNCDDEFYEALISAAPMHDLGKIAINDQILRKPGKFTAEEFEIMKTHSEKGAFIVENLLAQIESPEFVAIAKNVAWFHHERFDGKGYPRGLKGDEIPFEARIMAVADVYDALVSKRCYKEKFSFSDAFDIIAEGMGSQFDPSLWKSFYNCREKLEEYYKSST